MKIISWNVNGIRAAVGKGFFEKMEALSPDIICLQETKAQDEQVREALFGLGYSVFSNSAEKKGYSGTAILCKKEPISVKADIGIAEHDSEGRVLCADFGSFSLVTVYTPNAGSELDRLPYRVTWDAAFKNYLNDLRSTKQSVLVCGDLNVAHRPIDLKNDKANYNKTAGYTQLEIDGMDALVADGWIDTFRDFYPTKEQYTWWSFRANARARNIGWRIDYFLASQAMIPRVKEAFILDDMEGSDHCPVGVVID
jgi:exodeoxyribonuclease-3